MMAKHTKEVEVEVSPSVLYKELIHHIDSQLGMRDRWVDSEGNVCEDEEYYHGSPGTKVLSPASALQRNWYEARTRLHDVWGQL